MKVESIILIATLLCTIKVSVAQQAKQELWYKQSAEKWTDALPIGNGRIGAMIYSGVTHDHIQFNEETLWTGKPRNYNRKGAYKYLPEIRKLLFEGKQKEAEALAQKELMGLQSEAGDRKAWVAEMKKGKGMTGNPASANYDDKLWKTIAVPAYEGWETVGLANVDGSVWFRTTFDVAPGWAGKDLVLDLNKIFDQDFTYVNGQLVGNTDGPDARRYTVPSKLIKPGKNVIAIQVLNYYDRGGIGGYKDTSKKIGVYPVGATIEQGVSLVKTWKYKIQDQNPPAVPQYQASYQPFGDLNLQFAQQGSISKYKRSLDLATATVRTAYQANGVNFIREYFASQPNQAIVINLTADRKKSISFTAVLSSLHQKSVVKVLPNNTLSLTVNVKDGVLRGESRLTIQVKNGSIKTIGEKVQVINADEARLYLTAGTNFINAQNVSGDPAKANIQALTSLTGKSYAEVKKNHVQEYQAYYNKFKVNFGASENEILPTDERLVKFATSNDPAFAALYIQYGRYLLISSSRPGTQPANLQGIWNDLLTPPWGSKYTTNINMEMNYWPTEILNLSPLNEPLVKKIEGLAKAGAETAREYYDAPGWILHHNTDIWNATAPINASNHGIWVSGAAWLSQHLWEHYAFSQDKKFLSEEAYPLMKGAALFFDAFLVNDPKTGWLISTPSNSPENGGLVAGPTMDHQIIRTLFKNCIAAADILGVDRELRNSLAVKLKLIAPNQIGKYGQLQEWLEDKDDTTNKHRHVSHLWGVFPGNDITWSQDEKMMNAAKQSLLYRGDEATGWSLAWKINFWARFKDGDHAMELVKMLLKPAKSGAGSYVNLFDAHPPFQIDGNFGGAAGIAEMIVQSHQGFIDILPALPTEIPQGEISGLQARGGFELDIKWKDGKLEALEVNSNAGGTCLIRYKNQTISISTQPGEVYKLSGDLKTL
ncbi:glycoside hydrolase N-terminal domain-containing protein [Pedobacter sp. MC2016-05]|uniref:glycoside hydrolase family 95 protein n=1 Tax=Pedobacter sp. MC2016-05 TaxID=2994474 RepID=UPI00224786DD|nr:glycoside hydrolase N-terminal domain-containing protein [Pedobacter sp. MC2016-05]MCX2476665.1 glycoside hydrolase N-terminal domain-containing protein [Pedobacter sp. MC2016-05]